MNSFDMLSLGPSRMDVFVRLPDEVDEWCSIDRKRCVISLGFGEKVAVKSVHFAVGGNTGNNAVGLARLGLRTAVAGTMGGGWSDRQALDVLKTEGVNVEHMCIEEGKAGFGVVINYAEERTILSYYPEMTCAFPRTADMSSRWVYLTTAGENFMDFYKEAVDWATGNGARIAFNPGSRQLKAGLEALRFALAATEVLFVNREEGAQLLGADAGMEIKAELSGLAGLGPKRIVVTDGPDGTYLFDGAKFWHMPIVPAPVVERTGAGDAFGSGFLAALMKDKSEQEALRWGTCNSASVLGFIGPQAGLLNSLQMEEWLEKFRDVMPVEI